MSEAVAASPGVSPASAGAAPQKVPLPAYYIFLDESGNFDFSPNGSKYLILCGVGLVRPFPFEAQLAELRFDYLEQGLEIEKFHATEDKQHVRDAVFAVIKSHLSKLTVNSIVAQKNKTNPSLQPIDKFYSKMISILVGYIVRGLHMGAYSQVIVIADSLNGKKAHAIRAATKIALAAALPAGMPYKVMHHDSRSCYGLQVADYVTWTLGRKHERSDSRSYKIIHPALNSEFDVFRTGTRTYY